MRPHRRPTLRAPPAFNASVWCSPPVQDLRPDLTARLFVHQPCGHAADMQGQADRPNPLNLGQTLGGGREYPRCKPTARAHDHLRWLCVGVLPYVDRQLPNGESS